MSSLQGSLVNLGRAEPYIGIKSQHGLAKRPMPISIFRFVMRGDQGVYEWLTEPVVTAQGTPRFTCWIKATTG